LRGWEEIGGRCRAITRHHIPTIPIIPPSPFFLVPIPPKATEAIRLAPCAPFRYKHIRTHAQSPATGAWEVHATGPDRTKEYEP